MTAPWIKSRTSKITKEHVKKAVKLYVQKGAAHFKEKYNLSKAKKYSLLLNGKEYPSKAIVAIAYGLANPSIGTLNAYDFGGGMMTVVPLLENLGFIVAREKPESKSGSGEKIDTQKAERARKKILAEIEIRQGQPAFRKALLKEYGGKCTVSGCKAKGLLEAAHIIPHRKKIKGGENPHNGLLLRADLHTAFDKGLLAVNPKTMKIALAPELRKETDYKKLHDKNLGTSHPDKDALKWHWKHVAKTAVKK